MKFLKWLIEFFMKKGAAEPRENKEGVVVPPPQEIPVPKPRKSFPHFEGADKNLYPIARYVADPDAGGPMVPKHVVIHHTCSYDMDGTVSWFKGNGVDIHYIIGHDGSVVQMVPNNRQAAHAGKSSWNGFSGLNATSIGVEVVNIGPLKKSGENFIDCYDRKWKGAVRERKGLGYSYWEPFTKEQERALDVLCYYLHTVVGIPVGDIIGHYECSPDRKNDPYGGLSVGTMADYRRYLTEKFQEESLKA